MDTQCPYCQTKFSTPQEGEDREIKCPKCYKLFVIEKSPEISSPEVCTRCGNVIGRLEQACVFEGNIVCIECDNKLRNKEIPQSPQTETSQVTHEKVTDTDKSNINIVGIIISLIFFFIAFLPMINKQLDRQYETQNRPDYTTNPDVESLKKASPFIWFATGLTLFIRSFLPGLGFLRGILIVFGSFFLFATSYALLFMLRKHGSPSDSGVVVGMLLPCFIGGIMVAYGFRPKKGFRQK